MIGYIRIYRSIREHWIWQDATKLKWWLDILMLANYKPGKMLQGNNLVEIKRGAFHTSEVKLSERWGVTRRTVNTFLNLLEEDGMIATKRTKNGTTIEVLNYNEYQELSGAKCTTDDATNSTDNDTDNSTVNDTDNDTQSKKENKRKKVKESKETIHSIVNDYANNEELNKALKSFLELRKKLKKPLTERALKTALSKLDSLSNGNEQLKIAIVDQTLERGWQTFYEFKGALPSHDTRKSNEEFDKKQREKANQYKGMSAEERAEYARKLTEGL